MSGFARSPEICEPNVNGHLAGRGVCMDIGEAIRLGSTERAEALALAAALGGGHVR